MQEVAGSIPASPIKVKNKLIESERLREYNEK